MFMGSEEQVHALTPELRQVLEDVFGRFGENARRKAAQDPVESLLYLLRAIQERLPEGWAMLHSTIETGVMEATVGSTLETMEAKRERLRRERKLLRKEMPHS